MMFKRCVVALALAAGLFLAGPVAAQSSQVPAAPPPPAEAFARLPAIQLAEISPSGRTVAILGGAIRQQTVTLSPLDGGQGVTVPLGDVSVTGIRWIGDAYLIIQVKVFISETNLSDGRTYRRTLLRDIVLDGKGQVVNLLLDGVNWSGFALVRPILAELPGERPAVIVQGLDYVRQPGGTNDSRIKQKTDGLVAALWRVDVATGKGRMVERGSGLTRGWLLDAAGEPRVRFDVDKGELLVQVRGKAARGWTLLDRSPLFAQNLRVLGYSDAEDAVYLLRGGERGERVSRYDLATATEIDIGPDAPAADVGMIWDEARKQPLAIVSGGGEWPVFQWLDADLGKAQNRLARAMKGKGVRVVSWSADRKRLVVRVDGPTSPPVWYLFETETGQASLLGESYPELEGRQFGSSRWLTYRAADGLEMHAYLTIPAGLAPGAKAPLIVLPHGGPASRDMPGFDWLVQFLASRGYAVLQPQFRGSAGFGQAFEQAGHGEWGGKMQSDLVDAVDAAVAAGHPVDAGRACIVGASYGGFAALHGAVFRPGRYRCAVSINGVSDLQMMLGHARVYAGSESVELRYWREAIGDSRVSSAQIAAASPAGSVSAGTSPVLLIHSAQDTTVPIEQSRLMDTVMKRAGARVRLVELPGDDHYLGDGRSRLLLLQAIEPFLAERLAP